ncbi:MAG: copper chaperone PCu(A)C [Alphaproteobacteria bacterium]|nr:copper chaperone PCu(A)C [Alphaproteobacteria bacterium]
MIRTASATLLAAVLALAAGGAWAGTIRAGTLEIAQPWARATPEGAKVGGAYVTVANTGDEDDRLTGASLNVAGKVEIHQMSMENGVMRMKHIAEGLPIPAHGKLVLEPGSYHLMLMNLKRPLKAGDTVAGALTFQRAGTVQVDFTVAPIGALSPDGSARGTDAAAPTDHGGMGQMNGMGEMNGTEHKHHKGVDPGDVNN